MIDCCVKRDWRYKLKQWYKRRRYNYKYFFFGLRVKPADFSKLSIAPFPIIVKNEDPKLLTEENGQLRLFPKSLSEIIVSVQPMAEPDANSHFHFVYVDNTSMWRKTVNKFKQRKRS